MSKVTGGQGFMLQRNPFSRRWTRYISVGTKLIDQSISWYRYSVLPKSQKIRAMRICATDWTLTPEELGLMSTGTKVKLSNS